MHTETALVLTIVVLCYAVVSGLVRRLYLAPALIFVALGMILAVARQRVRGRLRSRRGLRGGFT